MADDLKQGASDLVMAMPRRELYGISGLVRKVSLSVLESVAEEHWFAQEAALAEDIDAKEVRIGLILQREQQYLVSDDGGVLMHTTAVPPDALALAPGVAALRILAQACASHLLSGESAQVELLGYLNDDAMPELRPFFTMVYRARCAPDTPAPGGFTWIECLTDFPLEPASAVLLAELAKPMDNAVDG